MGRIIIRQARKADLDRIVDYLRDYWRVDHVFVQSPELLVWQHQDPDDDELLNYALAERIEDEQSELLGLLGFMPFRRFDAAASWRALSLAIWHVRTDAGTPGLGLQLLSWITKRKKPDFIAAIGITAIVEPIYTAYGYALGRLEQAALFGPWSTEGIASGIPDTSRGEILPDSDVDLIRVDLTATPALRANIDDLGAAVLPPKSWAYLSGRFLTHPAYQYEVWAIRIKANVSLVIVLRRVEVETAAGLRTILRIVDMIGPSEPLARAGAVLQELCRTAMADYLDIVHYGIDQDILSTAGFVAQNETNELILPNYFEPFEQKRVTISIAFKALGNTSDLPVRLMRADSDQDRPNRLQLSLTGAFHDR